MYEQVKFSYYLWQYSYLYIEAETLVHIGSGVQHGLTTEACVHGHAGV